MKANSKCCKAFLISVIVLTAFYMALSFLVHHLWLAQDYAATASLWRSQEEMDALGKWWPLYYFIIASIVTCWFAKTSCNCPCCAKGRDCSAGSGKKSCCPIQSGGLCFGVKLGLLMGFMMGSSYLYMPIPFELAAKWFVAGLVQGVGTGIILGMICSKPAGSCEVD